MNTEDDLSCKTVESFELVDSQLTYTGRIGAGVLCNFLQISATINAQRMGFGLGAIQTSGHCWMLARMSVVFDEWPAPNTNVLVTTWPADMRGRLVFNRDYHVTDPDGKLLYRAASEWVLVDFSSRKIVRPPAELVRKATLGLPREEMPAPPPPPEPTDTTWSTPIHVRRSDLDINRHVNHIHYIDWLFEALPEELCSRRLARLDINYRAEALAGDVIESRAVLAKDGRTIHSLVRASDDFVLTSATCSWRP